MSFSRLRPVGRSFACLLIASGFIALAPAYAKDDGPEDAEAQTERSGSDSEESNSQDEGRQEKSADKSDDSEWSDDAAGDRGDVEEDSRPDKAEAPAEKPDMERSDAPAKPAQADAVPAAAPQKPVSSQSAPARPNDAAATPKAAEAPAVPATQQAVPQAPVQSPSAPQHDVYSERTDKILKSEPGVGADKVHPLELRYPDHNVVVCTAGCGSGGTVVHKRAKTQRVAVETAEMIPSAAKVGDAPAAASSNTMTCLAGCFTTPKTLRALDKRADLINIKAPASAATLPSSASTPASPAAIADQLSGKWIATPERAAQPAVQPAGRP